jgi:D-alanyl-D-alanine carboxypeptidase (penicillin-binding protein 5/6)
MGRVLSPDRRRLSRASVGGGRSTGDEPHGRHARTRVAPSPASSWRGTRRWVVWTTVGVVMVAAAVGARAATEAIPPPTLKVLLAPTARVPGHPARLAWPTQGEAALAWGDGTDVGTSGPDAPVPIASVAKVMTAYLVLRDHPLAKGSQGPILTFTASEVAHLATRRVEHQSLLAVRTGESLTEFQALQALLLPSADNVAAALARFDAGTRSAFVAKMNNEAVALGMDRTHFADPSGFDPSTVSTAKDLLLLARAAMAVPMLAAIVGERSASIPGVASFVNYNSLVGTDGFTGIKTGSTGSAGQALLFSVRRRVDGRFVDALGVVLEQHGPGVVTAAAEAAGTLVDSLYVQLAERTVLPEGTPVIAVSRAGATGVMSTVRPLRILALPGTTVDVSVSDRVLPRSSPSRPALVEASNPTGRSAVELSGGAPAPGPKWRVSHLFG